MRIVRLQTPDGIVFARAAGDGWVPIEEPYAAFSAGRQPRDLGDGVAGEVLAPTDPVVLVGIAQNGPDHVSPVQAWLKSPRTVVASGAPVTLRQDAGATVAEGEIAVVIGRDTTGLTVDNADSYILGVTAVNDLSSPDRTAFDPRNFESKASDGYTPLGPWIDTDVSIDDVDLELIVDGAVVAATGARELPVSVRACVAYVASWTRLGPGDVIMTGAPKSQARIVPGAVVEVRVGDVRLVTPTR